MVYFDGFFDNVLCVFDGFLFVFDNGLCVFDNVLCVIDNVLCVFDNVLCDSSLIKNIFLKNSRCFLDSYPVSTLQNNCVNNDIRVSPKEEENLPFL